MHVAEPAAARGSAAGTIGSGAGRAGTGGAAGGAAGAAGRAGIGGGGTGGATPVQALDMNDVTILAPRPMPNATPVLLRGADLADDGTPFFPRALFDRLAVDTSFSTTSPLLSAATYDRIQLVAVRFDLCDRHLPGACPVAEDGRLRLVFQPLHPEGLAQDVGFHAFYAIRNDELAGAVAALRELAKAAPPQTGALRVSPALSAANPNVYATKLRAFVKRYGGEARLVRLTMNAQPEIFAQIRWALRGLEKKGMRSST